MSNSQSPILQVAEMTPEPHATGDNHIPNSPSASEDHSSPNDSSKRKASSAGLGTSLNGRPVKRRASKACQCCRARKVRCNVVEHGAPCTNCRLDEVPCIVTESKRRKKHSYHNLTPSTEGVAMGQNPFPQSHMHHGMTLPDALASGSVNPHDISNFNGSGHSVSSSGEQDDEHSSHVPHTLYQNRITNLQSITLDRANRYTSLTHPIDFSALVNSAAIVGDLRATRVHGSPPPMAPANIPRPQTIPSALEPQVSNLSAHTSSFPSPLAQARPQFGALPAYIKPLPSRMAIEDVAHLSRKGALTIPNTEFRNELIKAYIEFVHPYMPLVDLHELLEIINLGTGETGKISLLLFQAVLFTGVAFVDMEYLTKDGYLTRKSARKAFYLKARALYDFDYESDRVAIVQALLLMTYWYETPDDQKDTWHWMGVAISLAHTIGLHRNPANSVMSPQKQKLWKRIWWSCFMRDRLVALGMRRPTRIKDKDFDVPMLELSDFELNELPMNNIVVSQRCRVIRDVAMQTDLAHLCIAKAKLCLCISHVLSAQYSVLVRDQGQAMGQDGNTRSSVMLFPKKLDQTDEVKVCDDELTTWVDSLPPSCLYGNPSREDLEAEIARGGATVVVQRALLHMCYYATLSALHRPQVLPSSEASSLSTPLNVGRARSLQDLSRRKVREASREITAMSQAVHSLGLTAYLPTTGVTVLLPAIIIHLLDIKSFEKEMRGRALDGFAKCMSVLNELRVNYAAADFAGQFLDAAILKAGIDVGRHAMSKSAPTPSKAASDGNFFKVPAMKTFVAGGQLPDGTITRLTPPPDTSTSYSGLAFAIPASAEAPLISIESKPFETTPNDTATANPFHTSVNVTTPPNSDVYSQNGSTDMNAQENMFLDHESAITNTSQSPHAGMGGLMDGGMEGHMGQTLQEANGMAQFDENFDALIDFGHDDVNQFGGEWNNGDLANGTTSEGAMGQNLEMGIHGESGGFLVDVDCVWQNQEAGMDFQWTAGSPPQGSPTAEAKGAEDREASLSSETKQVEGDKSGPVGFGGDELSDEERAVFLLKEGISA